MRCGPYLKEFELGMARLQQPNDAKYCDGVLECPKKKLRQGTNEEIHVVNTNTIIIGQ